MDDWTDLEKHRQDCQGIRKRLVSDLADDSATRAQALLTLLLEDGKV
jgi:hypothetical protein